MEPCSPLPVRAIRQNKANRHGRRRGRARRGLFRRRAAEFKKNAAAANGSENRTRVRSTPVGGEVLPGRKYSAGLEDRLLRDNISTKVQSNRLDLRGNACRAVKLAVTRPILLAGRIIATRNGKNPPVSEILSPRSNGTTGFFGTGMNELLRSGGRMSPLRKLAMCFKEPRRRIHELAVPSTGHRAPAGERSKLNQPVPTCE